MMHNRPNDTLFQLIKSLEKGEKRNFKLYVKRNSSNEDLKSILLFDALDKMEEYNEAVLLKKNRSVKKEQLANRKAHLYKQILSSLRLLETSENIDIHLHEQLDHLRLIVAQALGAIGMRNLGRAVDDRLRLAVAQTLTALDD